MRYVYWIIDRLLAGRPGPSRHPWDPAELYAGGIRTIVSLAAEEAIDDLVDYGFTHYQAEFPPVRLFSKGMRKAFIHQALPVWRFIHAQLEAGMPTLVHCYEGKDRTGVILAGYLIIYREVAPAQAVARVRAANPAAMTAEGYEEVVELLEPGVMPDAGRLL
ncbi:MAG: tyrosine-protein phosphatase [Anaerolineae bacterium]